MKTTDIERELRKMGWDLYEATWDGNYRAANGSFFTPYRDTPEQVLQDVLAMKQKQERTHDT